MNYKTRTRTINLALSVGALALLLSFASPATAGGGYQGQYGHGALHAAVAGLAVYGAISHTRGRGGHHAGRHHSRHNGHDRNGHRGGSADYYHDEGCHKVYKRGYYHGREARIGGTQCYDKYGNPYVVAGSRYVAEYY
ncbi:MAG: hypothetical protein LC637_12865 [Xanthomonadaceae bacterium]|nr:hypothetical protein [Xanthomonadaceae bacterium]